MESFIARQPIFDKRLEVFGYELLYRQSKDRNFFEGTDGDRASSETIMNSFIGIGIQKLTGGKRAFINFTSNLLEREVASLFPDDILVVEILEDVLPTEAVLEAVRRLKQRKYIIALDDVVYNPKIQPLLDLVDIIKCDMLLSTPEDIQELFRHVNLSKVRLLAEKIETREMFDWAVSMGFTYFQGYFFSKPVVVSGKMLDPLKLNYIQLIRLVNQQELNFARIARVIRQDVALTYRLMRLVNSAYYGLRHEVKSIKHALAILGTDECRKWISLISMMGISDGKPDELVRMSMVRGYFMEGLCRLIGRNKEQEDMFLTGLFSLIDTIMDRPMDEIMDNLRISDIVRDALLLGQGAGAEFLRLISFIEQGKWDELDPILRKYRLSDEQVSTLYVDSVTWCTSLLI